MPKNLRVVPKDDKWSLQLDGEEQETFDTQAEAEEQGRRVAKETGAEFKASGGTGQKDS